MTQIPDIPDIPEWGEKEAAEARACLRDRMAQLCIMRGEFRLSSGATSGVYFDCKRATLDGFFLNAMAEWVIGKILPQLPEHPEYVGGPTLGAAPMAAAIAMQSAMLHDEEMDMMDRLPDKEVRRLCRLDPDMSTREFRGIINDFPRLPVYGLLVRAAAKEHGARVMIENGPDEEARVLVVEDVITTGASIVRACDALIEGGHSIAGIFALLDRQAGGREMLEEKYNAPVFPLFKMSDFPEAREEKADGE